MLIKTKGEDEPFQVVPLEDFLGDDNIPDFEDDIKWRRHRDRAPRRRVSSSRSASPTSGSGQVSRARGVGVSTGGTSTNAGISAGKNPAGRPARKKQTEEEVLQTGKQLRQLSVNSDNDLQNKRRKGDSSSMDSCRSNDLNGALLADDSEMIDDLEITQ